MYLEFAVKKNRADPSVDRHYQAVDTNGVIDMSHYDLLVLRARYSHKITRTLAPAKDETSTGSEIASELPRRVTEDQTEAHERFDGFNRDFADFVRRVDPVAVLPKAQVAPARSRNRDRSKTGALDDDDGEDSSLRSPLESPLMLTEFKARAAMLAKLYSTQHLTLMICYYDFVIKNGLVDATGLAEFGGSDIAADVISFLNTFTTDAILHAGGRPWGYTHEELELRKSMGSPRSSEDNQNEPQSPARIGAGPRFKSAVHEVEMARAHRTGRRFLLNPNKLLGNNLRHFLHDRRVDWLSLDDVLDVLQQGIEDQAKKLERRIAKEPLLVPKNHLVLSKSKAGEDEIAPWAASSRRAFKHSPSATTVTHTNPMLDAVDEQEEEEEEEEEED